MAVWPIYATGQVVPCFNCEHDLAPANSGVCLGFGDGHGNYELPCPACGLKTYYDRSRSEAKAAEHNARHAARFEARRQAMRKPGVAAETGNALFRKWAAALFGKAPTRSPRPKKSAFDLPPDLTLGGIISDEVRNL